ncbi:hypothetical protein AgCh_018756 [Apium graveolens]
MVKSAEELPEVRFDRKKPLYIPFITGFGYDSRSNDYKIFRVVYTDFCDEVPTVQVYSTKADTWRDLKALIWLNKDYTHDRWPYPCSVKEQASHVLGFEDFVAMAYVSEGGSRPGIDIWALENACIEGYPPWLKCWISNRTSNGRSNEKQSSENEEELQDEICLEYSYVEHWTVWDAND